MADLKETVVITRELKGPRKDLVEFVLWLEKKGYVTVQGTGGSTDKLVALSGEFWDISHGED